MKRVSPSSWSHFAVANAALVLLWNGALAQALASLCAVRSSVPDAIIVAVAGVCTDAMRSIVVAALCVFALTMLLYWSRFVRGISDVGFVGGALRGERARHQGL
jgi:hypothetical protein